MINIQNQTTREKRDGMTELKYATNNELILKYQAGDDNAFTELYQQNEGLVHSIVNKYNHIKIVGEDVLISACYLGFVQASKNYIPNNKTKFSSYCTKIMMNEVFKEFNYLKQRGRGRLLDSSDSMNAMVFNKESETERIHLLDIQEVDKYFESDFPITSEAIDYALEHSSADFKEYIVPILCEEYSQQEIAEMFGKSKQVVAYQVKQFKRRLKEYMEFLNINNLSEVIN